MRARLLVLCAAVPILAGGLADASVAEAPARASASATLVTGTRGELGRVEARGDDRRARSAEVAESGIVVAEGEVVARAGRTNGEASARAAAAARRIEIFAGLVTASRARRVVEAADGQRTHSGTVEELEIEGRAIGDVTATRRYVLSGGAGSVTVNRGSSALRVRLTKPANGYPAGSSVMVAVVAASAVDGAPPQDTPTPTPAPAPTTTPAPAGSSGARKPPKRTLTRRRAPKVPSRLTAKRFAFPVYGRDARVADDFGAPRAMTGSHEGNDVFAPFGAPVLAVTDGELFKVGTLPISGNRLWLRSEAGDEFFYAHLSAFSPDAVNGRRVKAGQVLGFTGNTGDAEPTPPHVHFEIHPGGGDAIDPHAILTAWQSKRDVPPGAWLTRYGSDTEQRPGALVEVRDFIAGE